MPFHSFPPLTAAVSLAVAIVVTSILPTATSAHPGEGTAKPNPALLASLVALGGGAKAFSAKTMRMHLGGSAEEAKLKAGLGAATVPRFDDVFTFVVNDALATMKKNGAMLPAPAPAPSDTKAVAVALYKAGLDEGKFDVEQLFDTLFSQNVHMHAMMAVAQKYGGAGESAYHQVFGKLVADIGGNGKGGDATANAMHHEMNGMDMKGMPMPSPAATR